MQHAAAPTRGSEGLPGVAPRLLPHASSTPRCRLSNPETPSVFWIRAAAYVSSRSNRRPGPRWRRNGVNRHFLFCAAGNHANPRVAYRSTRLLCAIGANETQLMPSAEARSRATLAIRHRNHALPEPPRSNPPPAGHGRIMAPVTHRKQGSRRSRTSERLAGGHAIGAAAPLVEKVRDGFGQRRRHRFYVRNHAS